MVKTEKEVHELCTILHKEMRIKNENSEYITENVFEDMGYKKVDYIKRTKGRCVIHLYPTHDTLDDCGNLCGYRDALFFTAVICDTKNMEYTTIRNKDQVVFDNIKFVRSRIFKDMSSMYIIDQPMELMYTQEITCIGK